MKKLKCEECGGHLTVDEKGEYATCEYCNTKYKLNEDQTIVIKLDKGEKKLPKITPMSQEEIKNLDKAFLVPALIIGAIGIIFIVIVVFLITTGIKNTSKEAFNSKYRNDSGYQSCLFITDTIDNIVTNNKTQKKHLIAVKYNDKETTNPDEIKNIKKEACSNVWKYYEISFDYDKNGYINVMNIENK
jgi:hypothetical protein